MICKRKYHVRKATIRVHKDKGQQRGIFSVKLVSTKKQIKKLPNPHVTKQVCLRSCIASCNAECRRHSHQDWFLGRFIYQDSKMGLCKTKLCVKDNKHLVFDSQMWCSDRITFRKLHGKQTWHPFSKEGNSHLTSISLFLEKGPMDSQW